MKSIRPLALATFISDFGSALTLAVLPVLFLKLGHKDGIGIYNGFDSLGSLVGSLWIIAFIDRFRKNRIAVFADVIRGFALLPLAFLERPSISFVIFYSLTQSVFGAATTSAVQAWIGEHHFGEREVQKANSIIEMSSQVARSLAPLAGAGLLFQFATRTVFVIDAATYFIGAMIVWRLQSSKPIQKQSSAFSEFKEGLHYCLHHKEIMRWIAVSCVQFIGLAIINTVYLSILSDRIGASSELIAFFQLAYFIGAVAASWLSFRSNKPPKTNLLFSNIMLALVMVGSIFVSNYAAFFALSILQKTASTTSAISTRTLCQTTTDVRLIGRVMAFRSAMIDIAGIVFYGAAIWAFAHISMTVLLIVAAIGFLTASSFTLGMPLQRR